MITPVLDPTSKASVLWPRASPSESKASPAELSIVMVSRVRSVAVLMLKTWTGLFLILMLEMVEEVMP